ncbi:MAG TPA: hypothetical protein VIM62_09205 [Acidobacteriaceae bacterium]
MSLRPCPSVDAPPVILRDSHLYMAYSGRVEYAHERKIRARNTVRYRFAHLPLWIFVFFLAPGPLTFSLFAHGFTLPNGAWLLTVIIGVCIAGYYGQAPGCEPAPYILRFDEDRPNPLYRKVCYTFAWNAVLSFALLNLAGTAIAAATGTWYMQQIYTYAYFPLCAVILLCGAAGLLPRAGRSTKNEGYERRYFYACVWTAALSETILLIVWKTLPATHTAAILKLAVYLVALAITGTLASRGFFPRTRPIIAIPGQIMAID